MCKPTQAQIEAAARVLARSDPDAFLPAYYPVAEAALTAAAEAGESEMGRSLDVWQKNYGTLQAATIERCAQVLDDAAIRATLASWADELRKLAAAIRALASTPGPASPASYLYGKDKP